MADTRTPSAILSAAADLIRDTGKAAKPGPWSLYDRGVCWEIPELPEMHDGLSGFREVDARWIALLSPAVAPWLESILRRAAGRIKWAKSWDEVADIGERHLAEHVIRVLGGEDTNDGQ